MKIKRSDSSKLIVACIMHEHQIASVIDSLFQILNMTDWHLQISKITWILSRHSTLLWKWLHSDIDSCSSSSENRFQLRYIIWNRCNAIIDMMISHSFNERLYWSKTIIFHWVSVFKVQRNAFLHSASLQSLELHEHEMLIVFSLVSSLWQFIKTTFSWCIDLSICNVSRRISECSSTIMQFINWNSYELSTTSCQREATTTVIWFCHTCH